MSNVLANKPNTNRYAYAFHYRNVRTKQTMLKDLKIKFCDSFSNVELCSTALKYEFHSWNRNMHYCSVWIIFLKFYDGHTNVFLGYLQIKKWNRSFFFSLFCFCSFEAIIFAWMCLWSAQHLCTMAFCRPFQEEKKLSIRKGNDNNVNSFFLFFVHLHNYRNKKVCQKKKIGTDEMYV